MGLTPALIASLAVPVALWLGMRIFAGYPSRPAGVQILGRGEFAFLSAVAEVSFPVGGEVPPSGQDAEIATYVDRYLVVLPARLRVLMRALFFLMEHGTLIVSAGGLTGRRRFTGLQPDAQIAVLNRWRRSRLAAQRLAFMSLRSILGMAYLSHPSVQRALGLAPKLIQTPVSEADLLWPGVGLARSTIRYTRADLTAASDGVPLDPDAPLHPDYRESGA